MQRPEVNLPAASSGLCKQRGFKAESLSFCKLAPRCAQGRFQGKSRQGTGSIAPFLPAASDTPACWGGFLAFSHGGHMQKVNLSEKFSLFDEYWSPKIVGELNGQFVKLVKLKGEFVWHHHQAEDELFLVVRGRLVIQLRDKDVNLEEGEFLIVPRGVEHKPVAEEETFVLLFEPKTTLNTGNVQNERTAEELEVI
jgi:mannose-6-phosphate isomerase-like protein (cupin superfamily)